VKRDDHFSSDGDDSDDIPLVCDVAVPKSPAPPTPLTLPPLPVITYRLNWVSGGGFSSSIKQIRFLNDFDQWIFSAESKEVFGNPSWVLTSAHDSAMLGRLETPKVPAYTFLVPSARGEIDLLGFVWDGSAVRFVFLTSDGTPFVSASKDDRVAMVLKEGKPLPPNAAMFVSKAQPVNEKGKPVRHPDLPELSEPCDKNFVIEDPQGRAVMKIYKMAEKFFTVQAISFFAPMIVFACAIAVIVK
jgi:hypothetical protein